MKKEQWKRMAEQIVFPILLLLYPLRNVNIGVDLSDTTYSLANYMFLETKSGMNLFSTYLANVLGSFFMKLPFGDTMLGMNLYTGLLVSILALICYCFLKTKIPFGVVFAGEILAISLCWCPTTILYNYLTYFFFTLAAIFLYYALVKEKKVFFIAAGMILGWNVFVRFPNILETGLILSVWYYAFLHKKKFSKAASETGLCMAGFAAGIGSMLLIISIKYGFASYFAMLEELFVLGTGEVGYSPLEMIVTILKAYGDAFQWLLYLIVYGIAGVLLFSIKKEAFLKVKSVIYTIGGILCLFFLYKRGMFNTNYRNDYLAMFQWVAILLLFAIAYFITVLVQKSKSDNEKLMASLLLLIIVVTPLGSNNYIYPNINNMFLIAPVILYACWSFIRKREGTERIPIRILLSFILITTMMQSILFGHFYVFRGGEINKPWKTKMEQNEVLKGMYTSKENKESIEELTSFCKGAGLLGKEVILYGYLPGLSYALQMPCAISTTYPDMDSYPADTFEKELTNAYKMTKIEKNDQPVIIMSSQSKVMSTSDLSLQKFNMLQKVIKENYEKTYENNLFIVYQ